MAYNLQSLVTILEQILNPKEERWILDEHTKPQLESLLEKAASLQKILDSSSLPRIEINLESQIRDATHKAEDIIEINMVDQKLSRPQGTSFTFTPPEMQQVILQLDSAKKEVEKLMEGKKMSTGSSSSSDRASSSHDLSSKSVVVGVDKDMEMLKDRLTGMQDKLEIIPIIGMGGIGKTTLSRKLYEDPYIVEHFKFRAWATISQDPNMREILLGLLRCLIGKELDQHTKKKDAELKDMLRKTLYGRRYMIVLDDIWGSQFWVEIRNYFPDLRNGSRILITTRESGVAISQNQQHRVQLLKDPVSWDLLRQVVFGEDECCDELEEIGRRIASDCGGLPLAINVIGGLLSKIKNSRDAWEKIGNDVRGAIGKSHDERFSNILSLSYNHLPNHLRPYFLYMGAFPEDYEIKAPRLVRMWIAEGFLRSGKKTSLEEEAEKCLRSLVERNLVSVIEDSTNGKPIKYSMHDLLRDLCIKKADEEKFLYVLKNDREIAFSNPRRVSVHTSSGMEQVYAAEDLLSLARSFLCTGVMSRGIRTPSLSAMRLVRVLDVMEMKFQKFPREIFQLVNLCYLAVFCYSNLPSGISRLSNLQTLVASFGWGNIPSEIWEMAELSHLDFNEVILVEYDEQMRKFVQEKLQTISMVRLTGSLIRNGFLDSIPNIKELGIYCDLLPSSEVDLSTLDKLETLTCQSSRRRLLPVFTFPSSLTILTLVECVLFPGDLKTLSEISTLEVLIIRRSVFESEETYEEWEAEEDKFTSLKFLHLDDLNLVRWRADESNFPRLSHLTLEYCLKLEEIPSGLADIAALELIELHGCRASAVASAFIIQEEQKSNDENCYVQVRTR